MEDQNVRKRERTRRCWSETESNEEAIRKHQQRLKRQTWTQTVKKRGRRFCWSQLQRQGCPCDVSGQPSMLNTFYASFDLLNKEYQKTSLRQLHTSSLCYTGFMCLSASWLIQQLIPPAADRHTVPRPNSSNTFFLTCEFSTDHYFMTL